MRSLGVSQEAELGKLTNGDHLKSCTFGKKIKTVINKFLPHGLLELEEKKSLTESCLPYNDFENNKKNWT